jgi:hypothetical protein
MPGERLVQAFDAAHAGEEPLTGLEAAGVCSGFAHDAYAAVARAGVGDLHRTVGGLESVFDDNGIRFHGRSLAFTSIGVEV